MQQDDRMRLDNVLNAINILKQKFHQIRMRVQQYDPTEPAVETIEEGTNSYIALLDNKFNELIQMRPRINKLSDMEKRKFNALQRDRTIQC